MPAPGTQYSTLTHAARRDIPRLFRLDTSSRVLDIGSPQDQVVLQLRRQGITAFGLFDGSPTNQESDDIPALQPAILHAGIPFMAQSFDGILLRHSDIYLGPLRTPEACTATANLLACLKPHRSLIVLDRFPLDALQTHLSAFPGEARLISIGRGGVLGALLRTVGLSRSRPMTALQFDIPEQAISRKAWHRLALQAVRGGQSAPSSAIPQPHIPVGRAAKARSSQRS